MPVDSTIEEGWERARLIPTAGIRGQEEQEKRATSALLAVLPAVPDFGHAILSELGAPKGVIATFTEVRLKDEGGKTYLLLRFRDAIIGLDLRRHRTTRKRATMRTPNGRGIARLKSRSESGSRSAGGGELMGRLAG
jgi:hypothetical protein